MKRNFKSFIMLFAALFIYNVAGAQTSQKMALVSTKNLYLDL